MKSLPFGNSDIYVTILSSEGGTDAKITWYCINYIPPRGRCIIVQPEGGIVLAIKGKHWTEENGGHCYNNEREVPDSWCIVL